MPDTCMQRHMHTCMDAFMEKWYEQNMNGKISPNIEYACIGRHAKHPFILMHEHANPLHLRTHVLMHVAWPQKNRCALSSTHTHHICNAQCFASMQPWVKGKQNISAVKFLANLKRSTHRSCLKVQKLDCDYLLTYSGGMSNGQNAVVFYTFVPANQMH